jgi:ATP-dependent Clp protease ATP-binding subunit ClpB
VIKSNFRRRDIVLFIDRNHTLVGAGGEEGAMDAANILKPALGSWRVKTIGATTLMNIKNILEKTRHSKDVSKNIIEEPDTESAISILRGIKDKYETS